MRATESVGVLGRGKIVLDSRGGREDAWGSGSALAANYFLLAFVRSFARGTFACHSCRQPHWVGVLDGAKPAWATAACFTCIHRLRGSGCTHSRMAVAAPIASEGSGRNGICTIDGTARLAAGASSSTEGSGQRIVCGLGERQTKLSGVLGRIASSPSSCA